MVFPSNQHVLKTFGELVKLLPEAEKTKPQVLILAGEKVAYRHDTDRELSFRQESNFLYLSGCSVPSSFLILSWQAGTSLSTTPSVELFIPKAQEADLMWSVPPPNLEEALSTHDATSVHYTEDFDAIISKNIAAFPEALFHTLPRNSPLFPTLPELHIAPIISTAAITDAYLLPALQRARITKTQAEVELMREASEISSRAHEVVMRTLGRAVKNRLTSAAVNKDRKVILPGDWLIEKEAEAEAIFVASCRREGALHMAYLPIVAASTRAATLHYCCNDREFAWGPIQPHDHHNQSHFSHQNNHELAPQVLLIDAACEINCYASDITRTMPIGNGGKFTPEAKAIYSLVLEMQKASFDLLRPSLHWDAVQLICHRVLVKGFQRLGIFLSPDSPNSGSWNSEEAILASGISAAFFPHGVGHSLGLDVHDVPEASKPSVNPTIENRDLLGHPDFYKYLRLRLPLEKNMVVTVEPGIYFHSHLLSAVKDSKHINHEVLAKYLSVGGVRIEDVVLITDNGYENFTTVPSDVEWLENVCSGNI